MYIYTVASATYIFVTWCRNESLMCTVTSKITLERFVTTGFRSCKVSPGTTSYQTNWRYLYTHCWYSVTTSLIRSHQFCRFTGASQRPLGTTGAYSKIYVMFTSFYMWNMFQDRKVLVFMSCSIIYKNEEIFCYILLCGILVHEHILYIK